MSNSLSFPKTKRLLERADFQQVFKSETKIIGSFCIIFYLKNTLNHPRLGLAVTKKSLPHATARNAVKRMVRESFRRHQYDLPAIDIVVVSRKTALNSQHPEFFRGLERSWAHLLKQYNAAS